MFIGNMFMYVYECSLIYLHFYIVSLICLLKKAQKQLLFENIFPCQFIDLLIMC